MDRAWPIAVSRPSAGVCNKPTSKPCTMASAALPTDNGIGDMIAIAIDIMFGSLRDRRRVAAL